MSGKRVGYNSVAETQKAEPLLSQMQSKWDAERAKLHRELDKLKNGLRDANVERERMAKAAEEAMAAAAEGKAQGKAEPGAEVAEAADNSKRSADANAQNGVSWMGQARADPWNSDVRSGLASCCAYPGFRVCPSNMHISLYWDAVHLTGFVGAENVEAAPA